MKRIRYVEVGRRVGGGVCSGMPLRAMPVVAAMSIVIAAARASPG
jgi:hypothetical protein